ncbi:MAG: hypothetical protein R2710_11555 [Acidimicrobiales bacterium]
MNPPLRTTPNPHDLASFTDQLVGTTLWTDQLLHSAGIDIVDRPIVSIGGGLGSFALADTLRIAGLPAPHIAVLGPGAIPSRTYRYLASTPRFPTTNACVPMPARPWTTSGGSRATSSAKRPPHGPEGQTAPPWSVFSEPFGADYYTPRAGDVYRSIDREAERIGWDSMLHTGVVRMVRRRHGGGYFSILTQQRSDGTAVRTAYRSQHVHVAVGYPGVSSSRTCRPIASNIATSAAWSTPTSPTSTSTPNCAADRAPSSSAAAGSSLLASCNASSTIVRRAWPTPPWSTCSATT